MRGTTKKSETAKLKAGTRAALRVADDLATDRNYSAGDDDFEPPGGQPDQMIVLTAPENPDGTRIDLFLSRLVPQFSRSRLQEWLAAGRIAADGSPATPKTRLLGGETIEVSTAPTPEENAYTPEAMGLDILHEDAAVMVINKPAGLVVHPAAGNWSGTLLNGLLHHAPALACVPRAGIVHRLDKDTSGLMVVAKTLAAQTALVRQLQARSVRREYLAVAAGYVAKAGSVDAPIGRHPTQRKQMTVLAADASGAKPAITHFAPLLRYGRGATLVECRLETGRTHQIRVHLRHLGHPLVGDQVYGMAPSRAWFDRQALHAGKLGFVHPGENRIVEFSALPPADMCALMAELAAS